MAVTVKSLMVVTLPQTSPSPSSTYSPGTGKGAVIKSILLVNTTGNPASVTATLTKGAATMNICPPAISIPAMSSLTLDSEITLSDSDALKLHSGAVNAIDCVVSGIERDN